MNNVMSEIASVSKKHVLLIEEWFSKYVNGFYTGQDDFDPAIRLKKEHSSRVSEEIVGLAESIGLTCEQKCLAEIIGRLHDIGRFRQYQVYKTYNDARSEDHGCLGLRIIRETGVIASFNPRIIKLIEQTVESHNRAIVPQSGDNEFITYLKLVRDADKLDIYRVLTDYYTGKEFHSSIKIELPDLPEISDSICEDVLARRIVRYGKIKTLNDFKVLQLGWIFDMNFRRSFQLIYERKYLDIIVDTLPRNSKVRQIFRFASDYLHEKIK